MDVSIERGLCRRRGEGQNHRQDGDDDRQESIALGFHGDTLSPWGRGDRVRSQAVILLAALLSGCSAPPADTQLKTAIDGIRAIESHACRRAD
jgi:hypothetical protein